MKLLITGGAGFIGSNFIHYLLSSAPSLSNHQGPLRIINLDKLTYAGSLENLDGVADGSEYSFVNGDICRYEDVERAYAVVDGRIDAVLHFAAESNVDRSIEDPSAFIQTNVLGTQQLLDAARRHNIRKFVHVSTDEVYGSLGATGSFDENSPIDPNNPYSASKAAADLLVAAYGRTYGLPVCITRSSNNYGPRQYPDKLIPRMIAAAMEGKPLPVYGDGQNVRDWIYVEDHCSGIFSVLMNGKPGEVYNFGGGNEFSNISMVKKILRILGKPDSLIRFVPDRAGHDYRYSLDTMKAISILGWSPIWPFDIGLANTVKWYLDNREWLMRRRIR